MRSMLKVYIGWIHSIQVDDVINLLAIRLSMVYKCMQNVYVVRCKMSFNTRYQCKAAAADTRHNPFLATKTIILLDFFLLKKVFFIILFWFHGKLIDGEKWPRTIGSMSWIIWWKFSIVNPKYHWEKSVKVSLHWADHLMKNFVNFIWICQLSGNELAFESNVLASKTSDWLR